MINKDYILRMAEKIGRSLAIILGLRKYNQHEEALIYIDDTLLRTVGLTSRFINSISDEMLVTTISPIGVLNIEACLWIAALLKTEGDIYEEDLDKGNESYYRYQKSLYLFLTAVLQEHIPTDADLYKDIEQLLQKLDDYELPLSLKSKLFAYYELSGQYAKAEDTLFDLLETGNNREMVESGRAFYTRLLAKSDADLQAGNLARDEVNEGLAQLKRMKF
ncbi:MAG: DUF6483 family protein [Chloroflexota bacterium]|nr:DUF6483 family protein [Chloroflexota bacterium]